jgi:hypothetical protein
MNPELRIATMMEADFSGNEFPNCRCIGNNKSSGVS